MDIIAEDKVLIELKAVHELEKSSFNQIINYLKVFKIEVGLLINFGKESLEFKRFASYERNLRNH
jgi:GxxExxY protein